MPTSKHYGGHGEEVMRSMKKTYHDDKTAKRVFYATENKHKKNLLAMPRGMVSEHYSDGEMEMPEKKKKRKNLLRP